MKYRCLLKPVLSCLLICIFINANAQQYYNQLPAYMKANSVWAFGFGAGLNFNSGTPVAIQTAAPIQWYAEGNASVCDPNTGDLLFYTNGKNCWSRNHQLMPNGSGIKGNNGSGHQGACIIPCIENPGKYYLISLFDMSGGSSLWNNVPPVTTYSVVDMSLNSGWGDIIPGQKNLVLSRDTLSESMVVVPGNNCDLWLVLHSFLHGRYESYHIDRHGLDTVPVISNVIPAASPPGQGYNYYNYDAVVSPDRTLIAASNVITDDSTFNLFLYKFDPTTGILSDPLAIGPDQPNGYYDYYNNFDLAFSPDNSKLYVSRYIHPQYGTQTNEIIQYTVSTYTTAAINASLSVIANTNVPSNGFATATDLRLYRDTIYINMGGGVSPQPGSGLGQYYLHTINKPNLFSSSCGFQLYSVGVYPRSGMTLPLEAVYPLPPDTVYSTVYDTSDCIQTGNINKTFSRPGFRNYLWDNNSTDSVRTVTDTGIYWIRYQEECLVHVDTINFTGVKIDTAHSLKDTVVCTTKNNFEGVTVSISGFEDYVWFDGNTGSTHFFATPGKYWLRYKDGCTIRIDTINIQQLDITFSLGADTVLCHDTSYELTAPDGFTSMLWSDGSTANTYVAIKPETVWLKLTRGSCTQSDSIVIDYKYPEPDLGEDMVLCSGIPFAIQLSTGDLDGGANAKWSNGAEGSTITVSDTGIYKVLLIELPCIGTDSIRISTEVCECYFQMPNAFSPNNDDMNDVFIPSLDPSCHINHYVLNIYNRFGQRIFSGFNQGKGWNGTFNGNPVDAGTYYYEVSFEGGSRRVQYYRKGDIALIR